MGDLESYKFFTEPENIINRFEGERTQFVNVILKHCITKKIWTDVNIQGILNSYGTNRERILAALDYFDEKGWIDLKARQSVEVYDILTQAFDIEAAANNIFSLFGSKNLD